MKEYTFRADYSDLLNLIEAVRHGVRYICKPSIFLNMTNIIVTLQKNVNAALVLKAVDITLDEKKMWLLLRSIRTAASDEGFGNPRGMMFGDLYYKVRAVVPRSMWVNRDLYLPNVRK